MHPKILLPHARLLVEKYGAVVVAPEYRTAFEKPFPADLEDCYAALLFLKVHADELGINDAQIMVGGESAGAASRWPPAFWREISARSTSPSRCLSTPCWTTGKPPRRETTMRRCGTRAPTGSPGSTISAVWAA